MWLLFAILAPLLWALANPFDSALRRKYFNSDSVMTWAFAIVKLPVAIALVVVFSSGFTWGWHVPGMFFAGLLWMIPFILYYKALQFEETSRVILIMQFLPIFTFIVAAVWIQERLDMHQTVAFLLIFMGSVLAATKKTEDKWRFSKAFFLMALASFLWAVSDVMFKKFSIEFPNFWQAFGVDILGSSLPAILFIMLPKQKAEAKKMKLMPRRAWAFFIASAIAGTAGSMAFAYALTIGKASLVAVITGLQPLFVLIFVFLLSLMFKEVPRESLKPGDLLMKLLSAILILGGLAYLNLG